MNLKLILPLSIAAAVFAPAMRAEINLDIFADVRIGRAPPPPPPEVIVVQQVSAPPPPSSRWYQRSYGYYYYPGYDVYYRPESRMWFYMDGGNWRGADHLPPGYRVEFDRSVFVTLGSDRPYTEHQRVAAYYPPNYFTRVKFKNERDNRPDRNDPRRDNHDNGRRDNDRRDNDRDDHGKSRGNDNKR